MSAARALEPHIMETLRAALAGAVSIRVGSTGIRAVLLKTRQASANDQNAWSDERSEYPCNASLTRVLGSIRQQPIPTLRR